MESGSRITTQSGRFFSQQGPTEDDKVADQRHLDRLQIVREVQEEAACLAAKTTGLSALWLGDQDRHCSACESRVYREARFSEEVDHITRMWVQEQSRHLKTSNNLEHLHALLEAPNAAYRYVSGLAEQDTTLGLLSLPEQFHREYELRQRSRKLQTEGERLDFRRARLRQKARQLIISIRKYEDFGRRLRTEMDRYSDWLELRAHTLQRNYERYCEIMAERSQPPLVLYESVEDLARAKEDFLVAASEREQAAREGKESAYLDGRPDMLEDLYSV
ncbi:hypothetical protein CLCR_10676 [Cladophialophora carrionii]|uniref:Uncharacterized protein n=1 Tax=Cladophialophora carrionii TaxID=86049 RepID=A0A1C1CW09_9EURO|nr:hypothetical protein CLCR_10676 [Cladophialophora carrionii]